MSEGRVGEGDDCEGGVSEGDDSEGGVDEGGVIYKDDFNNGGGRDFDCFR